MKVGVGYDSDPEQVIALLRSAPTSIRGCCATRRRCVLRELRRQRAACSICASRCPTSAKPARVQSDLRIAILKALREANIEIPFNQLDVNLRDLDGLKRYLTQYMQERRRQSGRGAEPKPRRASNGKRVAGE